MNENEITIIKSRSPKSPKFIKPFELFMLRKKRKVASPHSSRKKFVISPLKCIDLNSPIKLNSKSPKRISTPNTKSPKSVRTFLFASTKSPKRKVIKKRLNFNDEVSVPTINLIDEDANIEAPSISNKKENGDNFLAQLPIDWSLKIKMRFISRKPFPYKGFFTATENAIGITSFVRCLYSDKEELINNEIGKPQGDQNSTLDTSQVALLKKKCLVWTHPHIPGCDLYPRLNSKIKSSGIGKSITEELLNEYCSSLKDLYDLLKARHCAYFYLCANSFTVLFRTSGVGGIDEMNALICPTTDGLRKKLKEQGIEFTLPLFEHEKRAIQSDEKEVNCAIDIEEEASVFLESLGVSLQDSSSLNKLKKSRSSDSYKMAQNTLVLVKGLEVQQLIPFFSNPKIVMSTSGPLANIPPTLISPIAFPGAHLEFLKLKQKTIGPKEDSFSSLEINGPILPNAVNFLCELFKSTVGTFKVHLCDYDHTSAFSTYNSLIEKDNNGVCPLFATESLKDCGFSSSFIHDLCLKEKQSCVNFVTILSEKNHYTINL